MLIYNLKQVLKARGIERPHSFLMKAGFSRHTATRILRNECMNIFAWHVEKLCTVLYCEPNGLFVWRPNKDVIYPEDFPLKKFERQNIGDDFMEALSKMPLEKFKELAKE